ncbi:MAG: exodeoxyribonuclease I [Gammaproteobacteria bacterium]|nr:exodeoxyribonuclease I [Gammaproteobacteria bacterium]
MALTLYWHDYETWGADPARDWPAQFAGLRTDETLQIVGKPLSLYCVPADDMLPQPEACLVTGITPQQAGDEGLIEAEFFRHIHAELARPGSCGVGYNSVRFDDEVTRYGLYRNFFDPYAREWQNGSSRWDIIDMVRLTHALRPDGIEWPRHDDGTPSFRLDQLTQANGIAHQGAHDALADVYATIELARLIRSRQPRLFDYIFQLRDKRRVAALLDLRRWEPVLHVSSKYPAAQGCIALVVPLAKHPINSNGIIVYDLSFDPEPLLSLSIEEVAVRLFTPRADLPEGVSRIPLKTVHLNKCPVVVPLATLDLVAAERWGIDVVTGEMHLDQLRRAQGVRQKIQQLYTARRFEPDNNPDLDLYRGGFFSAADRRMMQQLSQATPAELKHIQLKCEDKRIPEMLFRYRARNWPNTLSESERQRWELFRNRRIREPDGGGSITLAAYRSKLASLMVDSTSDTRARMILSKLADWPLQIGIH